MRAARSTLFAWIAIPLSAMAGDPPGTIAEQVIHAAGAPDAVAVMTGRPDPATRLVPVLLKGGGDSAWVWVDPVAETVVVGAVLRRDGKPLTPKPVEDVGGTAPGDRPDEGPYVPLLEYRGDPGAITKESILTIYFDPDCTWCRKLYRDIHRDRDRIPEGVAIAWVPVALLSSPEKVAGVSLSAASPEGMNMDARPVNDPGIIHKITGNLAHLEAISGGRIATPFLAWIGPGGSVQTNIGAPGRDKLARIFQDLAENALEARFSPSTE